MNKKYIYLISLLLVATIATGVYAAWYKDVPVSLRINDPLMNETEMNVDLTVFPGEIQTNNLIVKNSASNVLSMKITFIEETNVCDNLNLTDCKVTYTPIILDTITGLPIEIPTEGYIRAIESGSNNLKLGLKVTSGSEVGTVSGKFILERI